MKCPRCGMEMKRRKIREHAFQYVCPKCNYRIGSKEDKGDDSADYKEAYSIVMGRES